MNAKNNTYVNTKMHKKNDEFINLCVILFLSAINECDSRNTEGCFSFVEPKPPLMLAIIGMFECSLNLKDVNEYFKGIDLATIFRNIL